MSEAKPTRRALPVAVIVLLGLALLTPTLGMGFYIDDYVHQLVLEDSEATSPMRPWSLYDFGTRAQWEASENGVGSLPWWTGENWRIRFLRPVTSLTLWAQHALFGDFSLGYHLVGLALFALLIVLVHGLYRDLGFGSRAASSGALIFAVCDSVLYPACWPANLNSLLAALFAVGAVRAALPGANAKTRPFTAVLLGVLAVLSKESGIVALLFVSMVLARDARRRAAGGRLRSAPAAGAAASLGIALAHVAFLFGAGYGTDCLFYATPWSEPGAFAANVVVLVGAGLVSLSGPFPLDVIVAFPAVKAAVTVVGLAFGIPLALWIASRVRTHRAAPWLGLWVLLFVLVQGAAPPQDRLLFAPAVGAAGILALFFQASERSPSGSSAVRGATRALWLSVVFGSGLYLTLQAAGMLVTARHLRRVIVATEVGPRSSGRRDLFVLQAENQLHIFALTSTWGVESGDRDLAFWPCQIGNRPLRWTRVDESTFELESLGAPFLTNIFERVYLTEEAGVAVGDSWSTDVFEVEALGVDAGRPTHLRFRVGKSLDDTSLGFLAPDQSPEGRGRLAPRAVPPIGESLVLETPPRHGPFIP